MARSQIWDGTQWISMTGGAGENGGGGEPDENFLRLNNANNNASPNNFLRTVDADLLYLKLSGGTLTGTLRIDAPDLEGLLVKAGSSVASGGAVLIGAIQGNHFARMSGSLTDGGSNTRGFLEFYTRFNAGDADLTLVLQLNSAGDALFGTATGKARIVNSTGSQLLPTYAFNGDTSTGYYRFQANEVAFSLSGTRQYTFATLSFNALPAYTNTTAGTPNVVINSAGLFQRDTSALKYKDDVTDAAYLKDIDLVPVKFHSNDDDRYYYGMTADPLGAQDTLIGVYENQKEQVSQTTESGEDYFIDGAWKDEGEWEIENYDSRAVIAVMAAKINDQEERIAALENP